MHEAAFVFANGKIERVKTGGCGIAMSAFDPYLNWLGISVHEQPPNFDRLLGVVLFESNPAVIEQAADPQSLTVGAYQGGRRRLCQRLLSEIAMARFNLLDPQQKASYDSHLQGCWPIAESVRLCPRPLPDTRRLRCRGWRLQPVLRAAGDAAA